MPPPDTSEAKVNTRTLVTSLVAGVALWGWIPSASAADGNGASYCSNAGKPDGVVDVEAVQRGDLSTVNNPGEFVTALAPLPGSQGSGWGIQNYCNPRR
jgi:hypothetical protein